jgi:hypothetical protein
MPARSYRLLPLVLLGALAACHSDSTKPQPGLEIGQSLKVTGAQGVKLEGGADGAQYYAVLANTSTDSGAKESYTLVGNGLGGSVAALVPQEGATLSLSPLGSAGAATPASDVAFEARLRSRERTVLSPRIPAARAWMAARRTAALSTTTIGSYTVARRDGAVPSGVKVGDTVTVNVNGTDACSNPDYRGARVAAIGTHSIVLADTSNPAGGFTDADYQRYATRFDTLVYPLDVDAFGAPSDIDQNGRVVLIFTTAVNELTPQDAPSFVGGFTFARDLFPITGTSRLPGCATSNVGEYFYLIAPDPQGVINGNPRSTGFVDTMTTAIIAHEFQHLINSSRRIYVNNADDFEDTWLDEGLSHIAEELLFYRESGLAPKSNIDVNVIRSSEQRRTAFNLDMVGNAGRYRSYLQKPSSNSPYAANDSLPTRGAAWDLLRYLADQRSTTGDKVFYQLVNSTLSGIANVQKVFGSTFPSDVRDWNVSHAVDDVSPVPAELTQPSWNWHSIFPPLYSGALYPLKFQVMTDGTSYGGSVVGGGAAFYKLAVPANGSATLTLGGQSASAGSHLQLVVVRTQ